MNRKILELDHECNIPGRVAFSASGEGVTQETLDLYTNYLKRMTATPGNIIEKSLSCHKCLRHRENPDMRPEFEYVDLVDRLADTHKGYTIFTALTVMFTCDGAQQYGGDYETPCEQITSPSPIIVLES